MKPFAAASATILTVALTAATLASQAQAHHAINSQFDVTKVVPKSGVLTSIDNINPHAYWHFDIKNPKGKVEGWNIESVAPQGLRRAGISVKNDIVSGQTYNFGVAPSRNGSNTGLLLWIEVNGKQVRLVAE